MVDWTQNKASTALGVSILAFSIISSFPRSGEHNAVIAFDHWDGCYLYVDGHLMPVSERIKNSLRVLAGKPLRVQIKDVEIGGRGIISKINLLGPSGDPAFATETGLPIFDGLTLSIDSAFSPDHPDALMVLIVNHGNSDVMFDFRALTPTLLTKKDGQCLVEQSDGRSYAALTGYDVLTLEQSEWVRSRCEMTGNVDRQMRFSVGGAKLPRTDIPQDFVSTLRSGVVLPPRFIAYVDFTFQLPEGEYEFLAGYRGGLHANRPLLTRPLAFYIDENGKAHEIQ